MCRRDGVVASGNDIIVSIPRQSVSRETEAARPMALVKSRMEQNATMRSKTHPNLPSGWKHHIPPFIDCASVEQRCGSPRLSAQNCQEKSKPS